jgi:hypothetical protein
LGSSPDTYQYGALTYGTERDESSASRSVSGAFEKRPLNGLGGLAIKKILDFHMAVFAQGRLREVEESLLVWLPPSEG